MEESTMLIPDSEDQATDVSEYGFFVKDGKYFTRTFTRNNKPIDTEISNFVMKSLFHLINGTNDSQRIIFLQHKNGQGHTIEVFSSGMKPDSFETILKSNSCTFYGTPYHLKRVFNKLMDEEESAFIISDLGWNPVHQIFSFADAIFNHENKIIQTDQAGIIRDQEKNYYLPAFALSNLNNEDFKTERLYKYTPGNSDFKTWSNLYYNAFGENGLVGILFLILALYRDIVFEQVGFFPFLFLFGDFGTGKTSFTERMLSVFGRDTIGTPLNNATTTALNRLVSSRTNEIFYFKEYTNETDETAEDFILTAYDGAGRTTGIKSNDNKTKSHPIRSAIIFDGNHLPTSKSAILSRMILLNFENQSFSQEEKTAFEELKILSDQGLSKVLLEILHLRQYLSNSFSQVFKTMTAKIKADQSSLPERSINHISLIFTVFEISKTNLNFPFNSQTVLNTLQKITERQKEILTESSPVHIFWTSVNFNIKKGILIEFNTDNQKIAHYRVKLEAGENPILQIKFNSIYPFYVKYCKDNNIKIIGLSSLRMLLTSPANKTFRPSTQASRADSYRDKKFGSCYEFTLNKIDNNFQIGDIDFLT